MNGTTRVLTAIVSLALTLAGCGSSATPAISISQLPSPTANEGAMPTTAATATGGPSPVAATSSVDPLASVRKPIGQLGAQLQATVAVGGEPEWVDAGTDAVWVTNRGLGSVQRIDPGTNKVAASVHVAEACNGLAFGFGAVWTASCRDQTLVRIDPKRNAVAATIPTTVAPDGEGQLAIGFGSVWIAGGDGKLTRLDPKTNRFTASIPIPSRADAMVSAFGAIWMTDPDGRRLIEIDPATNKAIGSIAVGPHPQFLAADDAVIWVLNQDDGTVSRVDPAVQRVTTIAADSAGRDVGCIGAGLGASWVTVPDLPLTRIDAGTRTVTEQFSGPGGDCLTTGFGSVWLVNNALGTVSRIAP